MNLTPEQLKDGWRLHDGKGCPNIPVGTVWQGGWFDASNGLRQYAPSNDPAEDFNWTIEGYRAYRIFAPVLPAQEADRMQVQAVIAWLEYRGVKLASDLSDPGAITDQLSWYENAIKSVPVPTDTGLEWDKEDPRALKFNGKQIGIVSAVNAGDGLYRVYLAGEQTLAGLPYDKARTTLWEAARSWLSPATGAGG